jgi:hypothetical protein
MAQKVSVTLVDDIDGSEAVETVLFGLDGASYEIDLNKKNAAALRGALAAYLGHGRKSAVGKRGRRTTRTSIGPGPSELRDWARSNGYTVSDRGRVSAEIRDAFNAAH